MTKIKGLCSYCLGTGEVVRPVDDSIEQAELNNFHNKICPVCQGTTEAISEDTFEDEDEEDFEEINDGICNLNDYDYDYYINEEEEEEDLNEENNI